MTEEIKIVDEIDDRKKDPYRKLKAMDQVVREKVNQVYEVDSRLAILLVINTFGSSNIKRLGKILTKNEATIYHHIKWLTADPPMLRIDAELTRVKKGKYYILSEHADIFFGEPDMDEIGDKILKTMQELQKLPDDELSQVYIDMLAKHPDLGKQTQIEKRRLSFNRIIEEILISNFQQSEQAFLEGKKSTIKYPMGSLMNYPIDFKISHPKHIFKLMEIMTELQIKLKNLGKEVEKNADPDTLIPYHIHIFGGELHEFKYE